MSHVMKFSLHIVVQCAQIFEDTATLRFFDTRFDVEPFGFFIPSLRSEFAVSFLWNGRLSLSLESVSVSTSSDELMILGLSQILIFILRDGRGFTVLDVGTWASMLSLSSKH